ncbi:cobalamin B12-binding domain-containing protein [Altererythrobacter lutimaris]|uniref:Cobalamin B12-binding domain-containing protein n=1 Tax=Altererythrobacter lutimaris TaxID=2743979 RepID=A0A850H8Y7_9SPHN|nr:cobalamin B12-binding domain-containing protein [Altererythrobacter lutimaris]NVE95774.1 cobalamin B12-binding domain-containing protein [Altererythrobacter lutimaris]
MSHSVGETGFPVLNRKDISSFESVFIDPTVRKRSDIAERQSRLVRFVSGEVVPKLIRLHTEVVPDAPPLEALIRVLKPNKADISDFAEILLGDDLEAAANYVTIMRDRGLSIEVLYTELLEPTARFLGKMWERDECDFIDVTIGVGRLQTLLSIFHETYSLPKLKSKRHVLMAAAPGNQHVFGVSIIEELLASGGWRVQTDHSGEANQIKSAVRNDWFAVVGLTVGSDLQIEDLKSFIGDVRRASQHGAIGVMVGGSMFTEDPSLAVQVGADATAPNAPAAVLAAQKLFDKGAVQQRATS